MTSLPGIKGLRSRDCDVTSGGIPGPLLQLINRKVVRCLDVPVMHVYRRQTALVTSLDEVYSN